MPGSNPNFRSMFQKLESNPWSCANLEDPFFDEEKKHSYFGSQCRTTLVFYQRDPFEYWKISSQPGIKGVDSNLGKYLLLKMIRNHDVIEKKRPKNDETNKAKEPILHWIRSTAAWGPACVDRKTAAHCLPRFDRATLADRFGPEMDEKSWHQAAMEPFRDQNQ